MQQGSHHTLTHTHVWRGTTRQSNICSSTPSLLHVSAYLTMCVRFVAYRSSRSWPCACVSMRMYVCGRAFIVTHCRKPFSVVKTEVQNELKLSTYWLGVIDTAFLASYALGQLGLPSVLSRIGAESRLTLSLVFIGAGCVTGLFGLSSSGWTLVVLWFLNGLLHSAVFPLLVQFVSPRFSAESRGRIMGTWTTSQQSGATLATVFASFASEKLGWRAVFLIPAAYTILVGLCLKRLLPAAANPVSVSKNSSPMREIEMERWGDLESPPKELPHVNSSLSFLEILQLGDIKSVSLCYFCVKCVRYSLLFWLPYYLATELHYPHHLAGYASVVFDLGGFLGGLCTGHFADRVCSNRRFFVALLSCVSSAASLAVFALAAHQSTLIALALMALVGFTVAGADSIIGGSAASDICDRVGLGHTALAAASGESSSRPSSHSIFVVIFAFVCVYVCVCVMNGLPGRRCERIWQCGCRVARLSDSARESSLRLGCPLRHTRGHRTSWRRMSRTPVAARDHFNCS